MRSYFTRVFLSVMAALLLSLSWSTSAFAFGCPWRCREYIDDRGASVAECRNIGNGDMTNCYPMYSCIGEVCDVWCSGENCYWV